MNEGKRVQFSHNSLKTEDLIDLRSKKDLKKEDIAQYIVEKKSLIFKVVILKIHTSLFKLFLPRDSN